MTGRLTPEILIYGIKSASDPQISPDGEWVVYGVTTNDVETKKGSTQLWLSKIDGSELRQLTSAGTSNGLARWSPDGQSIAFVSDRGKSSGLYLLSFDGGDPRLLASYPGGAGEPAWSPDGSRLAFTAVIDPENPDGKESAKDAPAPIRVTSRIDYKQDTRGYLADKRGQIIVLDVESGETRQLTEGPGEHASPQWSPDGKTLAALHPTLNYVNSRLELIDVASGEQRFITPEDGILGTWLWTEDGTGLLVTQDPEWTYQHEVWLIPADGGTGRQITFDSKFTTSGSWSALRGPEHPVWIDASHALYHAASRGRSGLYLVDIKTGDTCEEAIWEAEHAGFSLDANHRFVAQIRSSFDVTEEVVIYDRKSKTTTQITNLNTAQLEATKPGQWERFDIERNGFTIESWLLKPADFDPSKTYPLILDIHGGPNSWYGYNFDNLREVLASNGFVVLFSNPRGSGSYGREFSSAVQTDWANEDYLDLMAVVDEAEKLPYIAPGRTGVYGYSYGGFMTSWIIGHTDRFKAAVIGAPVVDLISFYGTSDIGHIWGPHQFGGKPWEIREWYLEHSPITHLHNAKTPSLILHSEGDDRCPIGQGEQCFSMLKSIGVDTEFVRYPGGSHLFVWAGSEPSYVVDFLSRIVGWFEAHLTK
jgi:dipeptidyl aminopeptidase/acylaminoacyl peptidase